MWRVIASHPGKSKSSSSFDKCYVHRELTGDATVSLVSHFLTGPKLSSHLHTPLRQVSAETIEADAKYRRATHTVLSSKMLLSKVSAYLLQTISDPSDLREDCNACRCSGRYLGAKGSGGHGELCQCQANGLEGCY